jgi:hypothetical protein
MQGLKQNCTSKTSLRGLNGLKHGEIVESLGQAKVPMDNVQAIQITFSECFITFNNETDKNVLIQKGINIRDRTVFFTNVSEEVTNVTV